MNKMMNSQIFFKESSQTKVKTTCPYCGVGCGVEIEVKSPSENSQEREITVTGDVTHPANFGALCSKGYHLYETVTLKDRLLYPEVDGVKTTWHDALHECASRLNDIRQKYGSHAIAFYVSGQLLTEDYFVANKLLKGFIGSPHIDTNSRLCMSSSVAGYKRAFGSDTVPLCYEDLEEAECIVIIGANLAWCHPVLYQRIRKQKEKNAALKIIVIDPRATATCDIADLHLAILPGTDTFLFQGLFRFLLENQAQDEAFIANHTEHFASLKEAVLQGNYSFEAISEITGLSHETLKLFFSFFLAHKKTVSLYSQGVNQSSNGTDKVNSIINCHLLTGRIGHAGMGPFSITGQPNAMGGREVGGLANQLAAHMDYAEDTVNLVKRFWGSEALPCQPGKKAVDLFQALAEGEIKAVWIMATNPLVSMPDIQQIQWALSKAECVIVSDAVAHTDTLQFADIKFPAATWGERNGTVTNSERCISRQRPFFSLPGEAKPDWWIITQVARKMGFSADFAYESAYDVFKEHILLSAFENNEKGILRDFNLSGLTQLTHDDYERFTPLQWPITEKAPQGTKRMFEDHLFFTPSRKAQFIKVTPSLPKSYLSDDFPLSLNTGRVRDHWHTLTRTGLSPVLSRHLAEPFIAVHPDTAALYNLKENHLAEVSGQLGTAILRVKIDPAMQKTQVFAPIHWSDQFSKQSKVGGLIKPFTDPFSGQPEFKFTPVNLKAITYDWYGFITTSLDIKLGTLNYWTKITEKKAVRYEFALNHAMNDFKDFTRHLLGKELGNKLGNKLGGELDEIADLEWIEYQDKAKGKYRGAYLCNQQLIAVIMLDQHADFSEGRQWISELFQQEIIPPALYLSMLAGKAPGATKEVGRIICTCMNVGLNTILEAIKKEGLSTVAQLGQALKAGTQCGSCVAELKTILNVEVN